MNDRQSNSRREPSAIARALTKGWRVWCDEQPDRGIASADEVAMPDHVDDSRSSGASRPAVDGITTRTREQ